MFEFGAFKGMPAPARLITLNIGAQTVGLAKFRVQTHGGLMLLDYRFREILADPAGEGTRPAQITTALREMLDEVGIKRSSVNYAVGADRKSTRLNSSHDQISYAVFCLKKKKKKFTNLM